MPLQRGEKGERVGGDHAIILEAKSFEGKQEDGVTAAEAPTNKKRKREKKGYGAWLPLCKLFSFCSFSVSSVGPKLLFGSAFGLYCF